MLTPQEQSTLHARRSSQIKHCRDTVLIREGAPVRQVSIIQSGCAIATTVKAGRRVLLRLYGPGEAIGGGAALTGAASAETVTAATTFLVVLSLAAASFADFLRSAPGASTALHRVQQCRLDEADRLRTIRGYPSAAQQVAGLLLELSRPENRPGYHGGGILVVPDTTLTQEDLAISIGVSRKTMVRALAQLRGKGLITTYLGLVCITDRERLRRYVEAADAGDPDGDLLHEPAPTAWAR